MGAQKRTLAVVAVFAASLGCSASNPTESEDKNPGGKADDVDPAALCPSAVALNSGDGSAKRCYDSANGQFVPTECCADLCAGAEIRSQANGDRCAWVGEPGLPGAVQGQFAPALCCDLAEQQACGRAEGEPGDCVDPVTGDGVDDLCCEPVPQSCHPAIARSIDWCIYDQIASARNVGEPVPDLARLFEICTTELDALAPQLDARCEFEPDLPFCGESFDTINSDYILPCAEQRRPEYDCTFGVTFSGALAQSHLTLVDREQLDLARASAGDALVQSQIISAVGAGSGDIVLLEDAFERVDQGLVNQIEIFDLGTSTGYTAIEFGAGDNSVGVIFRTGTTEPVAEIGDDEISTPGTFGIGCDAPIGPGGRHCSSSEECPDGFRCEGRIEDENPLGTPLGLCVDQSISTSNDDCDQLRGCGEGQYCTGLSFDDAGFCGAGWMFGEREVDDRLDVPDGADARSSVLIYGQASVPMDLELTLDLFHDADVDELQVELLIPGPDDGFDEDRARTTVWPRDGLATADPTGGRITIPVNAFGDESINGQWTILVTDTAANEATGGVWGWSLRYSSRFD